MSATGFLGLRPRFAGLDALVPRMIKLGVTSTSAVSEPRTTATAATNFTRFRDDAVFEAYGTYSRRRRRRDYYWCAYVGNCQNTKIKTRTHSLIGLRDDLSA